MTLRSVPAVLLLACAFAVGTALLAWWAVPAIALVAGYLMRRHRAPSVEAAVGAAIAWGGILLSYRLNGLPIDVLTQRLSGAMQLPPAGLVTLSIAFPALLAGAAAALGGQMRSGKVRPPSPT